MRTKLTALFLTLIAMAGWTQEMPENWSVTVSLVTNVTERWPTHQESGPPPGGWTVHNFTLAVAYMHEVPDANPTNKWVRTTVKRVKTLKFDWQGQERVISWDSETVSDVEVNHALKRTEEWIPFETNKVITVACFTNGYMAMVASNLWTTNITIWGGFTNTTVWPAQKTN